LSTKCTPKAVNTALDNLTPILPEAYGEAMERIQNQPADYAKVAKQVLEWITFAFRPLSIDELRHALAIKPGVIEIDDSDLIDQEDIISFCAGMVTIDDGGVVRLIHYTAQEYLQSVRNDLFPDAHINLARDCLAYMDLDIFGKPCVDGPSMTKLIARYILISYAVQYWADHVKRLGDEESEMEDAVFGVLQSKEKRWHIQQLDFYNTFGPEPWRAFGLPSFSGLWTTPTLHILAEKGLMRFCRTLLGTFDANDLYIQICSEVTS
jgi:hypothetical protein